MADTSMFKAFIARVTDSDMPTSNVFLPAGTIRSLLRCEDAGNKEIDLFGSDEMFEETILSPLCRELQESGAVCLVPQKDGRLFNKEPLDKKNSSRCGYRFVWRNTAYAVA